MFVDRLLLAHADKSFVAAALPAGVMYFSMVCLFSATANFTSTLVAQFFGAGDRVGCVKAVWGGIYFALASSVILLLLIPIVGAFIINKSGLQSDLIQPALDYLDGLWLSGIFACLSAPLFSFFSGRGVTWLGGVIITFGCALNILFDYLLIFGRWGFPELGIYGGGIATTICSGVNFLLISLCFLLYNQKKLPTRKYWKPCWEYSYKIIKFGLPSGGQVFCDMGSFAFMTFLIGTMTVNAAASTAIALSITNLSFMPLLGLSQATTIVVGQYVGNKRHHIAEHATWRAWRMSVFYILFCATIYISFPEQLALMFAPNDADAGSFDAVVNLVKTILTCAIFYGLFDTVKFVFMAGLTGAGDTRMVFCITSTSQWLIMIPGMVLLVKFGVDIVTLWWCITGYFGFEGGLVLWRFITGKWKELDIIKHTA